MGRHNFTQIDLMLLDLDDQFAFTCNAACRHLGYGLLIIVGLIVFCILVVRLLTTCRKVDNPTATEKSSSSLSSSTLTDSMLVNNDHQSRFTDDSRLQDGHHQQSLEHNDSTLIITDSLLLVNNDQSTFTDDSDRLQDVHQQGLEHDESSSEDVRKRFNNKRKIVPKMDFKVKGFGKLISAMATNKQCTHTDLKLVNLDDQFAFTCNGCRDLGYGSCYTCHPQCKYHLHKKCHMPQATISHLLFTKGHYFSLKQNEPPQNLLCEACGMSVGGWRYALAIESGGGGDGGSEISLHPCCMSLPYSYSANGASLILTEKLEMMTHNNLLCCNQSNGVPGWAYVSATSDVALHVKCIKETRSGEISTSTIKGAETTLQQSHDEAEAEAEAEAEESLLQGKKIGGTKRKILVKKVAKIAARQIIYNALGLPHLTVIDIATELFN